MKSILPFFFFSLSVLEFYAQNLVPNPDFEFHTGCPSGPGQIAYAYPWYSATASPGGAEYFNQCGVSNFNVPANRCGNQVANSGNGYLGLALYTPFSPSFREYIEVKLLSPLIANECYHFEMYLSLADNSFNTTDAIGVYFSNTIVTLPNYYVVLNMFTPQIQNSAGNFISSLGWSVFSGDFTAIGGEQFIILGNFNNTSNSIPNPNVINGWNGECYCYVDDISLVTCSVLPIELISFRAEKLKNSVELSWTTATEINNDYFEIEKSLDGLTYSGIQKINGAGNSTTIKNYYFIDDDPAAGINYYRLKQVDYDGQFSYSEKRIINNTTSNKNISIYPNPATSSTTLYFPEELKSEKEIIIYNLNNEIVFKENIKAAFNNYTLDLGYLNRGLYFIIIEDESERYTSKILLE